MGTGEHARQLAAALRTQHIGIETITLRGTHALEDESLARTTVLGNSADRFAEVNLLCVNADSTELAAGQLGADFFAGRYTIGYWAWEVSAFPERFRSACEFVDEIWVGSQHVHDAVAPAVARPDRRRGRGTPVAG